MARRPDYRRVKIHRSYTVGEVAALFGCHENSVRNWTKQGLRPIDDGRPMLIHGLDLSEFLKARKAGARQTCPPGHIYCVACKAPKRPAEGMVEYIPMTATSGNLRGICPDCERLIHRRVAIAGLAPIEAQFGVRLQQVHQRIAERDRLSMNCDLE